MIIRAAQDGATFIDYMKKKSQRPYRENFQIQQKIIIPINK